jgi:AraC-like DNA-binding protein
METRNRELPIVINDISADSSYLIYTPTFTGLPFLPTGAGHFKATPRYYVERDNLNMYLVMVTINGRGELTYRNKHLSLSPGTAVFLNGMEYHKWYTSPDCEIWDFKWIRFSTPHFDVYDPLINQEDVHALSVYNTTLEEQCSSFLSWVERDDNLKDIVLSDLIQRVLTTLCVAAANQHGHFGLEFDASMGLCQKYIEENYTSSVTLKKLAEISCLTKFSFIRKFKKYMRVSPYAYLQKVRITKAMELLEISEKNVGEIADEVGFGDQNNFAKQFKLRTGMTPTQYRGQFRASFPLSRARQ